MFEFNFSSTPPPKFNQNDSKPPVPIPRESPFNAVYQHLPKAANRLRPNPIQNPVRDSTGGRLHCDGDQETVQHISRGGLLEIREDSSWMEKEKRSPYGRAAFSTGQFSSVWLLQIVEIRI